MNIAFLGAPSTGKTTICEKLADRFNTNWMPEFGREYWEKHNINRRLTVGQLVEVAEGHLEREKQMIQNSNQYLFTDTNAITTSMFSRYYHGSVNGRLLYYAEQAEKRYDLVFLCDTDIPYDDTWDRSGVVNRQWFQQQIEADLRTRKVPYITLSGNLDVRLNTVSKIISGMKKYDNLWNRVKRIET
jgi:NadR type nicotinamide-nucleotide adenylyltransferase